jgi:nucleoside-diphosphate-sugar epimerase
MNVALVVGALGVVGRALIARLEGDPGWRTIGLSRRAPDFETRAQFVSVDLLDRADCEAKLPGLGEVTHVFFTPYSAQPTLAEDERANLAMLVNFMEAFEPHAPRLAHVQLMQGTKWYGTQFGPFPTPAKEDDPRHIPPNFYYAQQDWLVERRRGRRWSWSALRPQGIWGLAVASPISQMCGLAIYGSISKALCLPLRFPGRPGAFTAVYQMTEAAHLAEGMLWAATDPRAADEAFNFTNGDYVRWCNLWPAIAEFFGCEPGPVQSVSLATMMADKEPLWAELVRRHGLKPYRIADLVHWPFLDWVYGTEYDQMSSMTKARQHGWTGVVDSQEMVLRLLGELRRQRIVP